MRYRKAGHIREIVIKKYELINNVYFIGKINNKTWHLLSG